MIYFMLLETEEDRKKFREIYENNYLKMYHVARAMNHKVLDSIRRANHYSDAEILLPIEQQRNCQDTGSACKDRRDASVSG